MELEREETIKKPSIKRTKSITQQRWKILYVRHFSLPQASPLRIPTPSTLKRNNLKKKEKSKKN
jgi:hypothetical protein